MVTISRVKVVDVGSAKTVSQAVCRGGVCLDQVDNINFRDHEPLGAGYVASWLISNGYEAEIVWPHSDNLSVAEVLAVDPQAVCFSSMTYNYPLTLKLAEMVKVARPEIISIIGGYHAASVPEEVLAERTAGGQPVFDFVVAGEGELSVAGILDYLNGQASLSEVEGIVYHDGDLWVKRLRRFDPRLNPMPLRPNEKMLQSRRHGLYYPAPSDQRGVVLFSWTRGCPYNCPFCSSKRMFPLCSGQSSVMSRDIGDIIEEINFCQQEFGTNFGFSIDLNAPGTVDGLGREWLRELCRQVGKTGLRWYAMCRLDVDPECFEIMRQGGCTQIGFGVESLTNSLKSGTRLTPDQWRAKACEVARCLRDIHVMSKFYYIWGGIFNGRSESLEDLRAESDAILDVECDTIRISWMVYPLYSPEFQQLQQIGMLEDEGRNYSLMSTEFPVIKVSGVTAEELQHLRTEVMRKFFSSQRYGSHARAQIGRMPEWERSFLEFDQVLQRQFGQGWRA